MPGMSGIEAFAQGVIAYLVKPVEIERLTETVTPRVGGSQRASHNSTSGTSRRRSVVVNLNAIVRVVRGSNETAVIHFEAATTSCR
jgi:DNA-binding NtrC family response regulator